MENQQLAVIKPKHSPLTLQRILQSLFWILIVTNHVIYGEEPIKSKDFLKKYNLNATFCEDPNSDLIISNIEKAKSQECRQQLLDVGCKLNANTLYPSRIEGQCKFRKFNENLKKQHLGCYEEFYPLDNSILPGLLFSFPNNNSLDICVDYCLKNQFIFAGLFDSGNCHCGNFEPDSDFLIGLNVDDEDDENPGCNLPCPKDKNEYCGGNHAIDIYYTGLQAENEHEKKYFPSLDDNSPDDIKVLFFLTISGRDDRHIRRFFKHIYRKDHFYLIHVDSRNDYLYHNLLPIEEMTANMDNVYILKNRMATMWAGPNLLEIHLEAYKELNEKKNWNWDYLIVLAESNYLLYYFDEFIVSLGKLRGHNFLNFQSVKISFAEETNFFHQCDDYLWKISKTELPSPKGLNYRSSNDWLILHRSFIDYILEGDELVTQLRNLAKYKMSSTELFYLVLLENSKFCTTVFNHNFHVINYMENAYSCRHEDKVGVCGNSPSVFRIENYPEIEKKATTNQDFFGRKFNALIDVKIINKIDEELLIEADGKSSKSWDAHWVNIYHHKFDKMDDIRRKIFQAIINEYISMKLNDHQLKTINEITVYRKNDGLFKFLIQFSTNKNMKSHDFEILVNRPKYQFNGKKNKFKWLIGTQVDDLDFYFRNMIGDFQMYDQINMILRRKDLKKDKIQVTFYDPTSFPIMVSDLSLVNSTHVLYPKIQSPYLPGVWFVIVSRNNEILLSYNFTILPTHLNDDFKIVHPSKDNREFYVKLFKKAFPHLNEDNMKEEALNNIQKKESQLDEWFNQLVNNSFKVKNLCSFEDFEDDSNEQKISLCKSSPWSSKFSDPKSEIHELDPMTGRLI